MIKISNSRMDVYNTCGYKYSLKYIEKWEADKTYTPLLFGSAMDRALNYILLSIHKKKSYKVSTAKWLFKRAMNKWNGQNELVFFNSELPEELHDLEDPIAKQWAAFDHLSGLGNVLIDLYIKDILPQFEEIIQVQTTKHVSNEEGDRLTLILDFVAKMKDGRIVLFDNKTSSNPKRDYPSTAVKKSQQLAIYSEQFGIPLCGYIVLPKKGTEWKMIIDEIPETLKESTYDLIQTTVQNIKEEKFEKNEKSCFKFGRSCEYYSLCKFGNTKGLIKK